MSQRTTKNHIFNFVYRIVSEETKRKISESTSKRKRDKSGKFTK